jgi:hypothetical protein
MFTVSAFVTNVLGHHDISNPPVYGSETSGSLNRGMRTTQIAIRLITVGILAYVLLSHLAYLKANVAKRDSISYWAAARLLVNHQNPYDTVAVLAIERRQGYSEQKPLVLRTPPWSLITVLPLALVDAFWAWVLWVSLSIAALAISARLCWKMFGDPKVRGPAWFWVVAYTFAPVAACLVSGQMGMLLLLGVVLFFYLEPRHQFLAGAALILPFAKPHLLALFWLVLAIWIVSSRKFAVALGFATSFATATGIAVLFDAAVFQHYRVMIHDAAIGHEFIPALSGVLRLLLFHRLFWVQFVPLMLAIIWAIWLYLRNRSGWDWREHGLALLVVSVLVTPYAWLTDEVVLLPAILQAGLWVYAARRELTSISRLIIGCFAGLNVLLLLILRAKVPFATGIYFWSSGVWLGWYVYARSFRTKQQTGPAAQCIDSRSLDSAK